MKQKKSAFEENKESVRKNFSQAIEKALTKMGGRAQHIDWLAQDAGAYAQRLRADADAEGGEQP